MAATWMCGVWMIDLEDEVDGGVGSSVMGARGRGAVVVTEDSGDVELEVDEWGEAHRQGLSMKLSRPRSLFRRRGEEGQRVLGKKEGETTHVFRIK